LQPRLPAALRTPSGKVELAPASLLADLQRPLQQLANQIALTIDSHPPLRLIGRRHVRSGNSWMHNLPTLAKDPYRCIALVHPQDAARLRLAEGSRVHLRNAHGALVVNIHITDEMMPGVVSLPHGWGHDAAGTRMAVAAERPGVNLNALMDDRQWDPLSGNAVLSGVEVTMEAV
jgi:anaerobic selenocysteine-containing dehydrogenase